MSRIYEALKLLQRDLAGAPRRRASDLGSALERRRGLRRALRVPIFVYGHTPQGVPFHEETHMTSVNSGGGLATLAAPVTPGQELLLVNLGTQRERPCRVLRITSRNGRHAAIALAFSDAQAEFWGHHG